MLARLQWEVSEAQWSDLLGDWTFSFGYRGCQRLLRRCDRDHNITHRIRTVGVLISTLRPAETVIR